jgi:demethylmenaquinone methyltransferase/2-methoxy-6-polyprenyl-1,4-benzoquinol methylase
MPAEQATHYIGEKGEYIREMFAGIADRYDLLNTILSFNRHKAWRKYAVSLAELKPGDSALDVCTGTGDFAVHLFNAVGSEGTVVASDFCAPMVQKGKTKTDSVSGGRIEMMIADALKLPYKSGFFDCVTVGFGIRNVSNVRQALTEMTRVARKGGRVVCLEFNRPRNLFWRAVVEFFEMKILPRIGGLISRSEAYRYLPASIRVFHSREELVNMMQQTGLRDIHVHDLNFGSVCIHVGTKA